MSTWLSKYITSIISFPINMVTEMLFSVLSPCREQRGGGTQMLSSSEPDEGTGASCISGGGSHSSCVSNTPRRTERCFAFQLGLITQVQSTYFPQKLLVWLGKEVPPRTPRSGKSFICKENIDNLHKLTS